MSSSVKIEWSALDFRDPDVFRVFDLAVLAEFGGETCTLGSFFLVTCVSIDPSFLWPNLDVKVIHLKQLS